MPQHLRTPMIDRTRMIPRFCLLTTFVAFAAVCSQIALNAIPNHAQRVSHGDSWTVIEYGWPWTYRTEPGGGSSELADPYARLIFVGLGFNVAAGMCITSVAAVSTELLVRVLRHYGTHSRRSAGSPGGGPGAGELVG